MEKDPFYFRQMEVGPMQNFAYLIGDCDTRECVAVDPAWQTDLILEQAKKDEMKITGILVTHTHYDHVNGVESLLQATDAKVYVNKEESAFLKSSRADSTGIFINISAPNLTPVSGGDKIKVGKVGVEFIHTPGHTPGSQCFLVEDNLISGDTLFIRACGRCDLPGGDPEELAGPSSERVTRSASAGGRHIAGDDPFRCLGAAFLLQVRDFLRQRGVQLVERHEQGLLGAAGRAAGTTLEPTTSARASRQPHPSRRGRDGERPTSFTMQS